MIPHEKQRLQNLQILRFVAAFLVVWFHWTSLYASVGHEIRVFQIGVFGVDLFFVLSGFIMAHIYANARPTSLWFLQRRAARLLPLYWLATVLFFVTVQVATHLSSEPATLVKLAKSLAFIPYLRESDKIQPLLFLGWTLNYEVLFYVVFAIGLQTPKPVGVTICLLIGGVTAGYVLQPTQVIFRFWLEPILLEFVAGMVGFKIYDIMRKHPMARLCGVALMFGGALVCVLLFQRFSHLGTHRIVVFLLPATMIVVGASLAPNFSVIWAQISSKLGDASYAIYLVHPYMMKVLIMALPATFPFALTSLIMIITVCATSYVTFVYFERPAMKAIQKVRLRKEIRT